MKSLKIEIPNKDNKFLSARLELPLDQRPQNFAIFAHCFTCNKDIHPVKNISRSLTANGIAVLRFDFTGLGQSEGEFADTNFSHNIDDLMVVYDYLKDNYNAPELLVGHSLGGAAVIAAGSRMESVKAIATIGAPADVPHVKHLVKDNIDVIEREGAAKVYIGGRPFTLKKQFLDDLERNDLTFILNRIRKSLLIIHSPQDEIVGIDNAGKLYEAANHPKSYISIDGADHLLSNKKDSLYVGEVISSWAKRYIKTAEPANLDSKYSVSGYLGDEEKFTMNIKAGDHVLTADEPESVGGNNFGPSPYELLSSSLAACTAMTLRIYAGHKKWDLQEVIVHIERDKKHVVDCEDCENPSAKLDHFTKYIELKGELDDAQKKRLLEIAEKCPVNKTLKSQVTTETILVD